MTESKLNPRQLNRRYARIADIVEQLGISKSTFWRMRCQLGFPKGRKIGYRTEVWAIDEIEAWLESRAVK